MFRQRDAFLFHLVSEHRSERDVPDALDVWHVCVELVLDHDAPARIFEVEAFDVWLETDGNENNIGIELIKVPVMRSPLAIQELKATHRLLLSIICGFRREDHLPILLHREVLCAQLEPETLLSHDF